MKRNNVINFLGEMVEHSNDTLYNSFEVQNKIDKEEKKYLVDSIIPGRYEVTDEMLSLQSLKSSLFSWKVDIPLKYMTNKQELLKLYKKHKPQ